MKIIEPSAKLVTGYDRRPEELIETIERWRDFLALRADSAAHPDMRVIAEQIKAQLFG